VEVSQASAPRTLKREVIADREAIVKLGSSFPVRDLHLAAKHAEHWSLLPSMFFRHIRSMDPVKARGQRDLNL
jgi:hypothetical protein